MLQNFNIEKFLASNWQKAPCLIQGALPSIPKFISPEELAGLALEPEIESRIIQNKNNHWQLEHGPFDETDFQQLSDSHWTLLIQTADYWLPEVSSFLDNFRFIPQWRFDDLMISYASDQGGVGPHFDNYDVFLVQTEGERHWRVGQMGDTKATQNKIDGLLHLENFTPIIDTVLKPGDILYIPPDTPHWGISQGNSMGYSVGYRAPQTLDLLAMLANHFECSELNQFFTDSYRHKANSSSKIELELVEWAQKEIKKLSKNQKLITQLLSKHLSQSKIENEFILPDKTNIDISAVHTIQLKNNIKYNWYQQDDDIVLSIEGNSYYFNSEAKTFIEMLTNGGSVDIKGQKCEKVLFAFYKTLARIVNKGYLLINS
ncbi:cupin domain-containing protein [Aliikangiella sp. IMCC44359]|uniref:cupin domain-containing protein n=1 Tax=Aliikangiella sp. IMCC44359 TaxID=3459125 RepID=UPI00403AF2B9